MTTKWEFDKSLAARFESEAKSHIPSYDIVIDKSIKIANELIKKTDAIIDVGSATGYTVKRFVDAGYTNVLGVENSMAMIEHSYCKDKIIHSNELPKKDYNLVIMNWTLHFVKDKEKYLRDVYENLLPNGYLILTDKTVQSDLVKKLYYDFKMRNGVTLDYILEKEAKLKGVMFCDSIDYYLDTLRNIGFSVEIVHADLGFVTFICGR